MCLEVDEVGYSAYAERAKRRVGLRGEECSDDEGEEVGAYALNGGYKSGVDVGGGWVSMECGVESVYVCGGCCCDVLCVRE